MTLQPAGSSPREPLAQALERANLSVGANFINRGGEAFLVRADARFKSYDEIGRAVVDVREAGDGGLEGGLFGEEFVDECARLRVWGLLDRRQALNGGRHSGCEQNLQAAGIVAVDVGLE